MIILTGVSAILQFVSHKNKPVFNKQILLFWCLYLGAVVGVLNSTNLEIAYFDLEKKLPWLSLPLIFFIGNKITKEEFLFILKGFLICLCCLNAYALTTPESFINQLTMTWHTWNESLPINRIYLGMYNVFGLVIAAYFFNFSSRVIEKIIYATIFFLLVVSLVNTFAKTAMVAFIAISLLELSYVLYKKGKSWFYAGAGSLVVITIFAFIVITPLQEVTKKILSKETFAFSNNPLLFESINFRYVHWSSSWSALKQDNNWITGVGTGDSQKLLDEFYALKLNDHERNYLILGYNSHNQYFTTWLNFGLVFLLLLVYQFFCSIQSYYKKGLRIGVYFILIIMFSCITESMFERQQGIVFYTFFSLLFFSRLDHKRVAVD
ncbi:MAG: O-antigen ligase family protein [Cyclobacteriaceae bacterium]|nr:O-antigen ligase family protein [Cyclobacteriaceae bacterium]